MNPQDLFEKMKHIQSRIENFIDTEEDIEENYLDLIKLLDEEQIFKNPNKFKMILHLLLILAKYHYRGSNFLYKLEKILKYMKNEIKQTFSNSQIFEFFQSHKLILLFLLEENILTFDETIIRTISNDENFDYKFFFKEINSFYMKTKGQIIIEMEEPENFEEYRKKGENQEYVCELIRKDLIEEFIIYVNKTNLSSNSFIEISIYETNPLLLKIEPTIIEYCAFYGSIKVFKYLFQNGAKITPDLWIYAIHGNNPELISFLEDNKIKPKDDSYEKCLKESIKCHHNDMADYLKNNYINDNDDKNMSYYNVYSYAFCYHNYAYFPENLIDHKFVFFYACQYDYINIVDYLMKTKNININEMVILKCFFFLSNEISYKKNLIEFLY